MAQNRRAASLLLMTAAIGAIGNAKTSHTGRIDGAAQGWIQPGDTTSLWEAISDARRPRQWPSHKIADTRHSSKCQEFVGSLWLVGFSSCRVPHQIFSQPLVLPCTAGIFNPAVLAIAWSPWFLGFSCPDPHRASCNPSLSLRWELDLPSPLHGCPSLELVSPYSPLLCDN